jgi:hypothetical protein
MGPFIRCLFASAFVVTRAVTPVEKVTSLLTQLSKKVEEDGQKEAVEYDRFACFCKSQADSKTYAIEKSDEKIASLTAEIESLDADIADLSGEVAELNTRIDAIVVEHDAEVSSSGAALIGYEKDAVNITEAITAVEAAIKHLKASKQQLTGAKLDFRQLQALTGGLLSAKLEAAAAAAKQSDQQKPAAYAYNSNDIIALLQDLQTTFKKTKKELDEAEFERKSASEKKLLGLTNEKKFKSESKASKEELIGSKTEAKHAAEADKLGETNARDADTQFRDELASQCEDRATEFDGRSKSRAAELTALADAIRVLKSGVAPKYSANKKLVGIATRVVVKTSRIQPHIVVSASTNRSSTPSPKSVHGFLKAPTAFLQVGSNGPDLKKSLLAHLDAATKQLGSPVLAALTAKLALRDASGEDHFVKVRGLIADLVAKLEAQALAEADSKSFCDKEMSSALSSRDAQKLSIEEQTTVISQKEAEIAQLTQEIATLGQEIADLQKAINEATELRSDEKLTNEKTIADAGAGKVAVEQAIALLQAYYDAQGGALLQRQPIMDRTNQTIGDYAPDMSYSGAYRGAQDSATGVIGILQIISSDFERTSTTVIAEEAAAQQKFAKFETDTKADVAAKESEKTAKETGITERSDAIITAKSALNDASGLHESAIAELENLKASCVDGEESWEERKAQREKEIEALKGALKILEAWQ